jgi:LacI family gluconate utilization system Gnt-I transcriptional repressor
MGARSRKVGSAPKPRRRGVGSVTLVDVANLAGVSKITASRALSKPELVVADTQRRVREAVAKLGYVPNLIAGGLKSNRSRLIACLVPTIATGSAFLLAVQAMTEAFAEAGYQMMLGQRGYDPSREEQLLDAIIARRPDGIVLTGAMRSEPARKRLKATRIPIVETWDFTETPIDMLVGFSHEEAGATIAEYLHRKGRRNVAMIQAREPRSELRSQGFLAAARRLGLARGNAAGVPTVTVDAPTRMSHGRRGLAQLLEQHPDIDAVHCASDIMALGALIEASSRGISVPEQLAIIGFGDLDFATDSDPPLTTVHVDSVEIGRRAAALMVARIEGKRVRERVLDLGFSIVERGSA